MNKWVSFLLLFWVSAAQSSDMLQWPEIKPFTLTSSVLGEERNVWVSLPNSYNENPTKHYPVIYTTDGKYLLKNLQGAMWALTTRADVPDAILVGVENPDLTRARDLTPTVVTGGNVPPGIVTGQSQQFERFIVEELVPWVNQEYRTDGFDVLAGHSFGGLFTLSSLLSPNARAVFEGYVAIDPSLWWDNQIMVERFADAVANFPSNQHMVYISAAWEEDIPSDIMELYIEHIGGIDLVSKIISNQFTINSTYQIETTETHPSVVYDSLFHGIRAVYQCYPSVCAK
ncbi:hypothetical protein CW749_05100 [Vibrio sp. vnigr-6D03]|uniref:alpha/beta hydrolase n=1 Tax=Vibrio sp. vnigr-6D03 TaxID=2058088 RepID=UPI000C32DB45|nr:alpha/beta hydrolase-fold protein [Vibrio sp. vnigr-6D03]PKF80718.1 hypothetical protein CW749_05100 [Vibrio sp. vnigr-6D03]